MSLPSPPRVLVLTMIPNGGALTHALRILGYNPYIFENVFRQGNLGTHPLEWNALLGRKKTFTTSILASPRIKTGKRSRQEPDSTPPAPPRDFDSLVGPPATFAYEVILNACPRTTKVILVEETDKLAWEKTCEQLLLSTQPTNFATRCIRWLQPRPMTQLHRLIAAMLNIRQAVSGSARRPSGVNPLQLPGLRLAAALDIFETQVKAAVPRDRLLVYRPVDGWEPLCLFLGHEIPLDSTTGEQTQFPYCTEDAVSVLAGLHEKEDGAGRVFFFLTFIFASIILTFASYVFGASKFVYDQYRRHTEETVMGYIYSSDGQIREGATYRGMLKAFKRATFTFEELILAAGGSKAVLMEGLRRAIAPTTSGGDEGVDSDRCSPAANNDADGTAVQKVTTTDFFFTYIDCFFS